MASPWKWDFARRITAEVLLIKEEDVNSLAGKSILDLVREQDPNDELLSLDPESEYPPVILHILSVVDDQLGRYQDPTKYGCRLRIRNDAFDELCGRELRYLHIGQLVAYIAQGLERMPLNLSKLRTTCDQILDPSQLQQP